MGSFEIIKRNGERIQLQTREPFCAVKSAVQNTSLMGDDNVQLSFVSRDLINLEKGDKILVFGEEYTLRTKAAREMLSETHYTYEATFYGVMYELMKSLYRNTDANGKSTKSTFDLTYSIKDFIKVLIYNVERDYPGLWKFDEANCPDTEPITLQFSKQNCLQVLQTLCSKENFNLDFRITQADGVRTIHIGKFGSKVVPPGGNAFFEWGKGNGLYKLKEEKVDDKAIITRLWVEGGTTNIRSGYRGYSERLQLPYPKRLNKKEHTLADGTVIPAESEYIGIDDDAKRYFEDAELREMLGSDEDSKEYDNIYPTRTGEVTALVDGDVNSFIDNTMDFDLCEKDAEGTKYLISGVTAKINFISGKLAGQQFEIAAEGGYIHSEKKFKLIPFTDERGLTIPTTGTNEAFRISVGDKYKITDINLPESYEQAAEEDLWYAGYDDFLYMKQARAQYQLTLDRKYFVDSLPEDSDTTVFKVGDYVPVRDTRFGIEKNIRIQKVSRNLLLEHDYALTLSDVTAISVYSQTVVDVIKHNQIIENNRLRDLNKARKGWRTTEELRNMVYDTDGYFDPENIRPNSIDTNMLTVGSKSQQFVLIDVVLEPNVSGLGNRLNASAGVLAHLSVEEDGVRQWSMGASEFTMANSGGYYLFAKCSKTGDSGVWYLTQKQLKFEPTDDPNNYYFQVGILSSLYEDGFRDFVTTHGFTRINGNTVTTGRIKSSGGGDTYFDLDMGEIGGVIVFKSGSRGYDNLEDKPDLSLYATSVYVNSVKNGLETQIDGKVETWFQSSNPWNAWASGTENRHVGDMWYDTSSKKLYRYIGPNTNNWGLVEDSTAIAAMTEAANAKDTADGKRRVFLTTPYTPYDSGDLWTNGTNIYRCINTRLSGSYNSSDWGLATNYDNTKTVIDGGVVTSGRIQLVGDLGVVRAGIAGGGAANTSVRVWAGGTFENRSSANARITEDGRIYGRNSIICETAGGGISAGFSSDGTSTGSGSGEGATPGSIRLWVGGASPDYAPFRVALNGIVDASQYRAGDARFYDSALHLPNGGQITAYSVDGIREVRLITGAAYAWPTLDIKDTYESGTMYSSHPAIKVRIGRSAYSNVPRTWIDCSHAAGWGSNFRVESRYLGDSDYMERTVVNVGAMMTKPQLQNNYSALGGTGTINGYPVYWDEKTKNLYINM